MWETGFTIHIYTVCKSTRNTYPIFACFFSVTFDSEDKDGSSSVDLLKSHWFPVDVPPKTNSDWCSIHFRNRPLPTNGPRPHRKPERFHHVSTIIWHNVEGSTGAVKHSKQEAFIVSYKAKVMEDPGGMLPVC